jgi:hypothetical protein
MASHEDHYEDQGLKGIQSDNVSEWIPKITINEKVIMNLKDVTMVPKNSKKKEDHSKILRIMMNQRNILNQMILMNSKDSNEFQKTIK